MTGLIDALTTTHRSPRRIRASYLPAPPAEALEKRVMPSVVWMDAGRGAAVVTMYSAGRRSADDEAVDALFSAGGGDFVLSGVLPG